MPAFPNALVAGDRWAGALRWLTGLGLGAAVLAAAVGTLHWPIVGDAPLFHYIAFLIDHGRVPYRDIVDINMPGTYALEWTAIHALGPGALAWRVFDFGLLAVCAAAMLAIAWPVGEEGKLAGWFGGALFALLHFRDGPTHTGQRDLMMTALLLVACAAMFGAVRRRGTARLVWAGVFGLAAGAASCVKPSGAIFAAVFAGLWWWRTRRSCEPTHAARKQRGKWGTRLCAAIGFAVPILLCGLWLWRRGALGAFVALNRGLVRYHASLGRPSFAALIVGSFPSVMLAVVIPAATVFWQLRLWRSWGAVVLMAGAAVGALSYVLQGKGFPYHRYPTEAFLALGCGLVLVPAMRSARSMAWGSAPPGLKPGLVDMSGQGPEGPCSLPRAKDVWVRWVALAGVLLGVLYLAPASAAIACGFDWRDQEFNHELAADLNALGGSAVLQQQVQCVDMTSGCVNTLYNLRIVQATGYLYDCYLFQPTQTPVSLEYRQGFLQAVEQARPRVLVVTDQQCFQMTRNWDGPARWPAFTALLAEDYVLQKQYTPPHTVGWWRKPAVPYSYRLYVRKDGR